MPTPEQCAVTDTKIAGIEREVAELKMKQDAVDLRLDNLTTMVAQIRAFVAGILVLSLLPDSILDILK
jgi:uncharacterized protein (DUF3084 family)